MQNVSRETTERLRLLESELRRWQSIKNLVGPGTLDDIWNRHIVDSLQLLNAAPDAKSWLDLGSGAGFPGLVLAIAGRERGLQVDLVESNSRKCAFLRHVARLTEANARVHEARLEAIIPQFVGKVDVVSARALALPNQTSGMDRAPVESGDNWPVPQGPGRGCGIDRGGAIVEARHGDPSEPD